MLAETSLAGERGDTTCKITSYGPDIRVVGVFLGMYVRAPAPPLLRPGCMPVRLCAACRLVHVHREKGTAGRAQRGDRQTWNGEKGEAA